MIPDPRSWELSMRLISGRVIPIRYSGPFALMNALHRAKRLAVSAPLVVCTLRTVPVK